MHICGALRDLVPIVQFKKTKIQIVQMVPNRAKRHSPISQEVNTVRQ